MLVGQALQLGAHGRDASLEKGRALGAEHHVLHHGEGLHQHEVLVDHADAGGDGRVGVRDRDGAAADADLAGVGLVEAVED